MTFSKNPILRNFLWFLFPLLIISFLPGPSYVALFLLSYVVLIYLLKRDLPLSFFQVYLMTLLVGPSWLTFAGSIVQDFVYNKAPVLLLLPIRIPFRFVVFSFFVLSLFKYFGVRKTQNEKIKITAEDFPLEIWIVCIIILVLSLGQIFGSYILKYKFPFFQVVQMLLVLPSVYYFLSVNIKRKSFFLGVEKLLVGFILCSLCIQGLVSGVQFIIKSPTGINIESPFTKDQVITSETGSFRSPGVLGHPNSLGVFTSIFIPSIFYLKLKIKKVSTIDAKLINISIVLGILGLFLSFSRWAWICCLFGVAALTIFHGETLRDFLKKLKISFYTKILLTLSLAVISLVSIQRFNKVSTLEGRTEVFFVAVDQMLHNPIWGVGPGNSPISLASYRDNIEKYIYSLQGAHNTAILLGSEGGLLVFMMFILFLVFIFIISIKNISFIRRDFSMFYLLTIFGFILNSLAYSLYVWDPFLEIFFVFVAFYIYRINNYLKHV